jgi:hypothetical protein
VQEWITEVRGLALKVATILEQTGGKGGGEVTGVIGGRRAGGFIRGSNWLRLSLAAAAIYWRFLLGAFV